MEAVLDIMLPYWGEPAYLYQAVHSVLTQDTDGWRLTVVDDHYPDAGVAEFFERLGDDRVRYLRNETNLGITDNYRRCLELVTADHMMFMGCDDIMLPGFVRTVRASLQAHPDVDIVQPGVQVIDEHGVTHGPLADRIKKVMTPARCGPATVSGEKLAVSLLHGDWLYWPSLVFRTESIRTSEFMDGFPLIQDLGIVLDMVARGATMLVLPQVCFSYRRHMASASSAKLMDGGRFAGEREFFARQAGIFDELGWPRARRAANAHVTSRAYALTLLPRALRSGNRDGIRTLLGHATARGDINNQQNRKQP